MNYLKMTTNPLNVKRLNVIFEFYFIFLFFRFKNVTFVFLNWGIATIGSIAIGFSSVKTSGYWWQLVRLYSVRISLFVTVYKENCRNSNNKANANRIKSS